MYRFFAVKLTRRDGSCAIFGHPTPTAIIVEVPDYDKFPSGHVEAMRLASEITGLPLDGDEAVGTSVEPVVFVLDQMLKTA